MKHKDMLTWGLIAFGGIFAYTLASHVAERVAYPIIDPILDRLLGGHAPIESTVDSSTNVMATNV